MPYINESDFYMFLQTVSLDVLTDMAKECVGWLTSQTFPNGGVCHKYVSQALFPATIVRMVAQEYMVRTITTTNSI